ncbi:hypothetical protein L6164_021195 [Bauhinia variegata]|uniref:Uncharacterized protein n=1 Tax=Bauhinia variegata TaxID=167791 RepID=A0ACB9MXS1_BAUVA|nr:hypothetical protein L6164_021195 [Bauhinia variegata]
MAETPTNPVLQKPPGYKDPSMPGQPVKPPIGKPVLPISFQPKKSRRSCCGTCCCIFCIVLLIFVFVLIIVAGLVYIIYDPRVPVFRLQSFRIPRLTVADKPDGKYLDAQTMARVEVKNPSAKMVWYFEDTSFEISANDGDVSLGSKTIPAFSLKQDEATSLKVETRVKGTPLDDGLGKNLKGLLQSKEFVPNVKVRTKAGVGLDEVKVGMVEIEVECGHVTMKGIENGQTPKCTITFLKWLKIT